MCILNRIIDLLLGCFTPTVLYRFLDSTKCHDHDTSGWNLIRIRKMMFWLPPSLAARLDHIGGLLPPWYENANMPNLQPARRSLMRTSSTIYESISLVSTWRSSGSCILFPLHHPPFLLCISLVSICIGLICFDGVACKNARASSGPEDSAHVAHPHRRLERQP